MARAVQCPACGQTHPVDRLAGTPTFACEGCGRTLRTPTELVRPSGSTPAVRAAAKPASQPAAAAPRRPAEAAPARAPRTRVAAAPPGRPATARSQSQSEPESPRARRPRRPATVPGAITVPLRVGAWVVAVVFGLILTWFVASAFGFISRAQLVDMFRSSSPGNYIRLYLLIPVWAFMSACLATGLIEGVRLYLARREGAPAASRSGPQPDSKAAPTGSKRRLPPRPSVATSTDTQAEAEERPSQPAPPPETLPPGQRRRIRPREPTV